MFACESCCVHLTLLLTIIIILFLWWTTKKNNYFKNRSVKYVKPIPLFGNFLQFKRFDKNAIESSLELYQNYKKSRFFGILFFTTPAYIICDPELIKVITVKDFDHFMNHQSKIDVDTEPLLGRNLASMHDQKWKIMRTTLSPAFTGHKMRAMFSLVVENAMETSGLLCKQSRKHAIQLEFKDFFTRFTSDVIASCAFGLKVNSLENRKNEFYMTGKRVTNLDWIWAMKLFGYSAFPQLMKLFRISLLDEKARTFLRNLVHGTIRERERHQIYRPDMINVLMQAKKGDLNLNENDRLDTSAGFATAQESPEGISTPKLTKWEDDDLTAQCLMFILAGFETSATLMCFMAHELAVNQKIQNKLFAEIQKIEQELKGKPLTYDCLQKMKYMDMVVSETLRKWPPAPSTDRCCNKSYTISDNDGNSVKLEEGVNILIPIYAIHMDPEFYPDPDIFDPERFSDENRSKIKPFTFIPFGSGPRNCIGSRFALMECKAIFYYLLLRCRIEMGSKTQHPLELKRNSFTMQAEKGFWIKCCPRFGVSIE